MYPVVTFAGWFSNKTVQRTSPIRHHPFTDDIDGHKEVVSVHSVHHPVASVNTDDLHPATDSKTDGKEAYLTP